MIDVKILDDADYMRDAVDWIAGVLADKLIDASPEKADKQKGRTEADKQRYRRWYAANRDRIIAERTAYRNTHREQYIQYHKNYRLRKKLEILGGKDETN